MTFEELVESMMMYESFMANLKMVNYQKYSNTMMDTSFDVSWALPPKYYGTNRDDVYYGRNVSEYYYAKQGDDQIIDGNGYDYMFGEEGQDEFFVSLDSCRDVFVGGRDTDFFYARLGGDSFYGGDLDGRDTDFDLIDYRYCNEAVIVDLKEGLITARYNSAYDRTSGVEGARGTIHDDILKGSETDNQLYGGAGSDYLYGYGGDDYLSGGAGNDYIYGGDDHDALHGWDGNDVIQGGEGNDYINGGRGNDKISLGAGDDTFVFCNGHGRDIVSGALNGDNTIVLKGFGDDVDSFSDILRLARTDERQVEDLEFYWTIIELSDGDSLRLNSVRKSDLTEDMFSFV